MRYVGDIQIRETLQISAHEAQRRSNLGKVY